MALDLQNGRYVFFNSLRSSHNRNNVSAYKSALQDVASIRNSLKLDSSYKEESEKHLGNIRKYLSFIRSMIDSLRANEIDFLEDQLSRLPEDSPLRDLFPKDEDLSNFNYTQINEAFNLILQDQDQYEKSLEIQRENMKTIQDSYLNAAKNKDTQERLDRLFEEKYTQYVRELMAHAYRFDASRMKSYKQSLTKQLAARANMVMKDLSGNSTVMQAIQASISATGELNMSDAQIQAAIINVVTDRVINAPLDMDVSNIVNGITDSLINHTKETFQQMEGIEFSRILQPDFQELEQLALTTNKSLGAHIVNLDDESIENIKKNYPEAANDITNLIKTAKKNKVDDATLRKLKTTVTKNLKAQIKARAQQLTNDPNLEQMTKEEFANKFKDVNNFITSTKFAGGLQGALAHVSFQHQSIAEILASNNVKKQIAGAIANNIPGVTVSFKADIRFSVGAIPESAFEDIDLSNIINDVVKDNYSNFLLKYKEKSSGQTDVAKAMEAYSEWLDDMKKQIDEMIELDDSITDKMDARKKAYEELYKTFSASISVKDYDVYNNILGFHGGSLGGKKSPEQVFKNITDMYQLGGLTDLDVEALMFAAMNCGDAMVGGADLRHELENFLVGGAALIMFDDSFAASEEYFKNIASEFRGQKIVNIYRLNTEYKTASYVLEGIYQSLVSYYGDLENAAQIETVQAQSRVTIINDVTPDDIPKTGSTEEKWKAISDYTQKNIQISFSFMGGLLDTINKGPNVQQ